MLRAIAILAGSIGVAVVQPRLAAAAFLGGGVLMVLGRCLAARAALRAIDLRVVLLIAAAVPLGLAMDLTGTGTLAARTLDPLLAGWGPIGRLLVMFWAAALLTQLLSDAATTVLLAPIALHLAGSLGPSPEAAVICTAVGAVAGFLTPIGHHGSLLVLRPGGYRFADYLRVGLPLTAFVSIATITIAAWRWPLAG
jgi:di/tricarboxylate transporter